MTPVFEVDLAQGTDWYCTVNWYGGGVFRAPIEEIDPGYPTRIRVSSHLLPTSSDTPIILSGIIGAEILNSKDTGVELCSRVDADYFEVPVSTVACEWLIGTGEMTYHKPEDISTYTARCKFKKNWHSPTIIIELTTENGGITLDGNDGSIQLYITDTQSAAFTQHKMYGDVELISAGGIVTRTHRIIVSLERETTV